MYVEVMTLLTGASDVLPWNRPTAQRFRIVETSTLKSKNP
jgi:hypothetical protein